MRGLNALFVTDLKAGKLKALLEIVKKDDTLCMEIRQDYINIYYRGGNILKVTQQGTSYKINFDSNYCVKNNLLLPQPNFSQLKTIADYIEIIPLLKREMDLWFYEHPKIERESQQLILRENNLSCIANDTDYYISDIEYADSGNGSRFDLVGVKWLSNASSRKKCKSPSIVLMELKYGDSAMTGSAGIVKHFDDIDKFISGGKLGSLILETQKQFNQKVELGLIRGIDKIIEIDNNVKPEFIILCANHKLASKVLLRELKIAAAKYQNLFSKVDVRIAQASYLGYGLYANEMVDVDKFISRQIDGIGGDRV